MLLPVNKSMICLLFMIVKKIGDVHDTELQVILVTSYFQFVWIFGVPLKKHVTCVISDGRVLLTEWDALVLWVSWET